MAQEGSGRVRAEYRRILRRINKDKIGRRPRTVIMHILKHGYVTTGDLLSVYGYNHPPRAIRDVKDLGIPVRATYIKNARGRRISKYEIGDWISDGARGERRPFPRDFKRQISDNPVCVFCSLSISWRMLQIDHRIPVIVGGDNVERIAANFMLACPSCNRAKSWSCESCENSKARDAEACKTCYWASPLEYTHVALSNMRRIVLTWQGGEIDNYNMLDAKAGSAGMPFGMFLKNLIKNA